MNFDQAASYLHGLTRLGIKLGNERFEALLDRLGNPHRAFKAIHIAGTKGKGSTAAFSSAILHAQGYRVGTYLSPYVYDLRERIQIDGEMIPKDEFARLVTKIRPIAEELAETEHGPTTEFEMKTAIGFSYFAEQRVEAAVIEAGLGGRLDATNVLPNPAVSVITNIGYDHMNLLGSTLTEIAGEKAGIVKNGGICVTGAQAPEALAKIEQVCAERGATLIKIAPDRDWHSDEIDGIRVKTPKREITGLRPGLQGEFQQANAALAVKALDYARGIELSDDAIRNGLAATRLPGRLETVRRYGPTILVDAAHNEMAAEALAVSLERLFASKSRPVVLVVGMSRGHEPLEFLKPLLAGLNLTSVSLVATEPEFRPREASEIAQVAQELGAASVSLAIPVTAAAGLAVDMARAAADNALVLVTGSFYTLGELAPERWQEIFEARGMNTPIPPDIWENRSRVML